MTGQTKRSVLYLYLHYIRSVDALEEVQLRVAFLLRVVTGENVSFWKEIKNFDRTTIHKYTNVMHKCADMTGVNGSI